MNDSHPLFLLFGNGAIQNRGCEAILRSTTRLLHDEFGACRFVNAPNSRLPPPDSRAATSADAEPELIHAPPLGRAPAPRFSPGWLVQQLERRGLKRSGMDIERFLPDSSAALLLGGDQYSFDYGVPWPFFNANEAVLRSGTPLVLWGASVGPFDSDPAFEARAAEQLRRVTLICARESETVAYLEGLGVAENVVAVSDPAFELQPAPVDEPVLRTWLERGCMGLNLAPLLARYWGDEEAWLRHCRDCVASLLDAIDLPLLLVPHVVCPGNDDHEFLSRVAAELRASHRSRVLVVGPDYDARQLKWIISQLRLFAGSRTHATIAALSTGVPTISVGYSVKARGINQDVFGHDRWLIQLRQLDAPTLAALVGDLLSEEAEVRAQIARVMPAYRDRARLAARHLKKVLPGR